MSGIIARTARALPAIVAIVAMDSARAQAPSPAPFNENEPLREHADEVASYTLHAKLDPAAHTIHGEGTIRLKNASKSPLSEVWLHLYLNAWKSEKTIFQRTPGAGFRGGGTAYSTPGHIDVTRFAIQNGADLWPNRDKTTPGEPDDETDIRVPLPSPLAPGDTLTVDVAWDAKLPPVMLRTGYAGSFHMAGQWFPKLAKLGEDGRFVHFPFHRYSEFFADFGAYDVTVDTPSDMVVGATGKLVSEARDDKGGRTTRRYVQNDVHDFAFTAWPGFHERTTTASGVAIRILFPAGAERAAEVELDTVRFGLDYFGRAYGRYPYETLTIVHPPDDAEEAGGMEYPTLITTGGSWYEPYTGVRSIDVVTIHELGHEWFYGLVATDEHHAPFLDEGLNSFAEADAMEARFPGKSGGDALGVRMSVSSVHRMIAAEVANNAPVAQGAPGFATGGDYGGLVYSRTATIIMTLGNVFGRDKLRAALGAYTRRFRFRHPGPNELLDVIGEFLGADAKEMAKVALFDKGTVDYRAGTFTSERAGDHWEGNALVRRSGNLIFPVEVDLFADDGATTRVLWDAKSDVARLPYKGKSRLVAVVIDPDHKVLLDQDLTNNARKLRSSSVSRLLLARLAYYGAALLAGMGP